MVHGNASAEDDESALELLYKVGLAHSKRGKPRDAVYFFDKILLVAPEHFAARFNKANALGKLGRYEEAITQYDHILKSRPGHSESLLNKGLSLHYLRRYEEAAACYSGLLLTEPANASALYHLACTRILQNKPSESLELLEKAVILDPDFAVKASKDPDFASLHGDKKFHSLIS